MRFFQVILLLLFFGTAAVSCGGKAVENSSADVTKAGSSSSFKVTFIELGSVNCVPCRMMQPIMEDISKEFPRDVKVVFYDVWTSQGQPYGRQYRIRAIPTQVFLDSDGREFFRHEGFLAKEQLVRVLKQKGAEK